MARIRSVHPGLFTDEAFVGLSGDAQIFYIGLWTEADDQGVFEWKPTTLRMRLRPTKDGSVDVLLAEMQAANCIMSYEINGRHYGAIRNFKKFQRPKFPKFIHPITAEVGKFISSSSSATEIDEVDDNPIPRNAEKPLQMERRGEKEEEENKKESARARDDPGFLKWYEIYPRHEGRGQALKAYRSALKKVNEIRLLAGAEKAKKQFAGIESKFIPMPATWLNGERWDDEAAKDPAKTADVFPDEIYRGLQ